MKSDFTFLQEIMMVLNAFYTTADKLANLRRLERVFFVAAVFVKRWKITKKDI